jgi:hypothetical protein
MTPKHDSNECETIQPHIMTPGVENVSQLAKNTFQQCRRPIEPELVSPEHSGSLT